MSKERYNQIIDEAYENYHQTTLFSSDPTYLKPIPGFNTKTGKETIGARQYMKEEFINQCKTDIEFSEKWGLKIEERELSWEERRDLLTPNQYDGTALNKYGKEDCGFGYISPFTDKVIHYWLDLHNIPTKLITLTYNNETIEVYE